MLSEQSKGLFNRAIAMSGVSFNKVWSFTPPLNWAERLARHLGFRGRGEKEILEFLEATEAADLVIGESQLLTREEKYGFHLMFPFGPVVEPYKNEKTFVPSDPIVMAREAWSKDIDCIIGAVSFEGLGKSFIENENDFDDYINTVKDNVAYFAPVELKLDVNSEKAKSLGRKIREVYYGDKEPSRNNTEHYYHVRLFIFI